MVASDLGFLALGGILGLLAGAALLAVLRTRPPAPRQIRLTVTPGSVPIRPSRTTLDGDPFAPEPGWMALGGPAGTRRLGTEPATATALAGGARNGTLVRSDAPHDGPPADSPPTETDTETGLPDGETESVGIAIGSGPDPVLAAIAASGARAAKRDGSREDVVVVVERPGEGGPLETTEDGLGVAILEAAIRARRAGATAKAPGPQEAGAARAESDVTGTIAVLTRPNQRAATNGHRTEARSRGTSGAGSGGGHGADRPTGDGQAASASPDQCAEARTTVDERCALAERMRITAGHAAEVLRQAQGTYDAHIARAAAAEAIAESRAQRAAKDEAQNRFRTERSRAGSREAVEQAARDWLQEINRINAAAREAATTLAREREAAAALQASIERLTIEADAARLQAEGAEESCSLARKSLAAIDAFCLYLEPVRALAARLLRASRRLLGAFGLETRRVGLDRQALDGRLEGGRGFPLPRERGGRLARGGVDAVDLLEQLQGRLLDGFPRSGPGAFPCGTGSEPRPWPRAGRATRRSPRRPRPGRCERRTCPGPGAAPRPHARR